MTKLQINKHQFQRKPLQTKIVMEDVLLQKCKIWVLKILTRSLPWSLLSSSKLRLPLGGLPRDEFSSWFMSISTVLPSAISSAVKWPLKEFEFLKPPETVTSPAKIDSLPSPWPNTRKEHRCHFKKKLFWERTIIRIHQSYRVVDSITISDGFDWYFSNPFISCSHTVIRNARNTLSHKKCRKVK